MERAGGTGWTDGFLCGLPDGTSVVIRPVLPDDHWRVKAGFALLSEKTRFQRFFRAINHLSDGEIHHLTHIDQRDHVAWAALDPSNPDHPGLGLARFIRDADDPEVAEVAFIVIDSHHRRGIGTLLLAVLLARAAMLGVRTLRAVVRPDNEPVLRWLRGLGAEVAGVPGLVSEFALPTDRPISALPAARRLDALTAAMRRRLSETAWLVPDDGGRG